MTASSQPKKPRKALGMGLDALLPDRLEGEYFLCPVEEIHPSPQQPRKDFHPDAIAELAQSIREKGLIQPVILRRDRAGRYELIAGERRWRAAQKAGLTEVPAIVKEADDEEVLELALIENLQREDLNAVEEAEAYRLLVDRMGLTQEQVADRIGKSRAAVANTLRLLALPAPVLQALRNGAVTAGHARAILAVSGDADRLALLQEIQRRGLSVRQAEAWSKRKPPAPSPAPDPDTKALEARLSRQLGARTSLRPGRKKHAGSILIEYRDLDDLDRILAILEGTR